MQDRERIHLLIRRYRKGIASEDEVRELLGLIRLAEHTDFLEDRMAEGLLEDVPQSLKTSPRMEKKMDDLFARIISRQEFKRPKIRKWYGWQYAAGILIALSIGIYAYVQNQNDKDRIITQVVDIKPGGNKATLTLADGSTIALSDAQSGIVIGYEAIKYSDGSALLNTLNASEGSLSASQANMLSLTTPKGGQYQVTLPDGTKVWLNAASTLQYPAHFVGKERRVVLNGEAYFEVAKNLKQVFIVSSEEQEVKVLGTHFNINTFKDEGAILTTLVEGSVQISAGTNARTLIPGQQALVSGNSIQTRPVHTNQFTAWKDDLFVFKKAKLKTILLTLSRWYDFKVDVSQVPEAVLSGEILRNVHLSEVLNMLEETSDVQFKIVADGTNGTERRLIIEE